jgi:Mn-dependent DtxR family transcriptional regulator
MKIENRGRGLLTDRTTDLEDTLDGVRTGVVKLTNYMRNKLEKAGYLKVGKAARGTGKRVQVDLTREGERLADKAKRRHRVVG